MLNSKMARPRKYLDPIEKEKAREWSSLAELAKNLERYFEVYGFSVPKETVHDQG